MGKCVEKMYIQNENVYTMYIQNCPKTHQNVYTMYIQNGNVYTKMSEKRQFWAIFGKKCSKNQNYTYITLRVKIYTLV